MALDLSIIIVSWNTRQLLRDCLRSVFDSASDLSLEVFIADNASSDGSVEMVRTNFPQVCVIENRENIGFAAANNRVFPLCQGEFVLLLNSDTIVKAGALRVLCEFLRTHPQAGAVGPKLIHSIAQLRVLGCGKLPTLRTIINHYFFLSILFPRIPAFEGVHFYLGIHDEKPRSVGWVSGACIVVRRSMIDKVGMLTERWFMYAEDQEWCARMIAAGWDIYHVPDAVVEHYLGASARHNPSVSLMPFNAGRDLFLELNRPSRLRLLIFDLVRGIGCAVRAGGYFIKSLIDRDATLMWREKVRTFLAYALDSFSHLKQGPNFDFPRKDKSPR